MTTLLAAGYDHLGVPVDLYGTSTPDGIEIEDVRLAGHSLIEWFSNADLRHIEDALECKAVLVEAKEHYERQLDNVCQLMQEAA